MSEDTRRRSDSLNGISRGEIAFRLESLEEGQRQFSESQKEMMKMITDLTLSLAKLPATCGHAEQCAELSKDVKEIQQDRYKAKGSLWAIGVVCTFLGFVISQANSFFSK